MEKDDLSLDSEITNLTKNSNKITEELQRLIDFMTYYITSQNQLTSTLKQKMSIPENHPTRSNESTLLTNIINIYDSFQSLLINLDDLTSKLKSDVIDPLDEFKQNQEKINKQFIDVVKEINNKQKNYKTILDIAKINYYKEEYYTKEDLELNDFKEHKYKGEKYSESEDILLKNKMRVKVYENIYNYELVRYNKNIEQLNNVYNFTIDQMKTSEKSRINFIKNTVDNVKNYVEEYAKNINDFSFVIDNYISRDVCSKDELYWNGELSKYKSREHERILSEKYVSFKEYMENNNTESGENELFNYEINLNNKMLAIVDEKEQKIFIHDVIEQLTKEEDIPLEKIAILIELFDIKKKNYDYKKLFLDNIVDIKKPSVKYLNLNNLEVLSNVLSYISLNEDSIFKGKFELNFKIIYAAERVFYQNKYNNNKIYLSAVLSKNKYFRTRQFWRNIIELKLAHKLCDYIERLRNLKLPEEKKKGIFSKIGKSSSKNLQEIYKNTLLSKSRILPLIKYYKEIDCSKISLIDKMATQEISTIIQEIIQNSSNFNFPTDVCFDLITKLTQEYKINKENMRLFFLYANVCSYTVRKKLESDAMNYKIKNVDHNNKLLKIFSLTLPFLEKNDFFNLLKLSKFFNKKLKKKICSHMLNLEPTSKNLRLKIWEIFLQIPKIKEKYNYQQILKTANDEKTRDVILLDVNRTSFNPIKCPNESESKEKLTNVLYATALVNNGIKYCQGMNFLVEFLLEIYDEEETFYIYLSLFESTEYSIIFTKDLHKMKVFFYVFKRIMTLFEPELSNYLNSSGVHYNFFLPPWFITLFTGSHQYHNKEEDDNTDLIIKILDNFIIYGWNAMMEFSCAILHLYEPYIMNLRYDEVMHFLINDILKSDFFGIKNKENIIKACSFYKIKKKLVKNIEEEHTQNVKINENIV